jgi:hypothetical protein
LTIICALAFNVRIERLVSRVGRTRRAWWSNCDSTSICITSTVNETAISISACCYASVRVSAINNRIIVVISSCICRCTWYSIRAITSWLAVDIAFKSICACIIATCGRSTIDNLIRACSQSFYICYIIVTIGRVSSKYIAIICVITSSSITRTIVTIYNMISTNRVHRTRY